jgi:hypothetical protein
MKDQLAAAFGELIEEEQRVIDEPRSGDPDYHSPFEKRVNSRQGNWYKVNVENKPSATSSSSSTEKEHLMNTTQTAEKIVEDIAEKASTKKDAAEQAFAKGKMEGFDAGRMAGKAETFQETMGNASEKAKGVWGSVKGFVAQHKTAIGVALGVAATVGTQAAVVAAKNRRGDRMMRVGDTAVTWGEVPPAEGNMAGGNRGGGR